MSDVKSKMHHNRLRPIRNHATAQRHNGAVVPLCAVALRRILLKINLKA